MQIPRHIAPIARCLRHYLLACGVAANLVVAAYFFYDRAFFFRAYDKIAEELALMLDPNALIAVQNQRQRQFAQDIAANFTPWRPLPATQAQIPPHTIQIAGKPYLTLASASAALQDHQVMTIGEGIYHEPLVIARDNAQVNGAGRVVFDGAAAEGKAAIVIKGKDASVRNIECQHITVPDHNGACLRVENTGITVDHVYFHDSEQGLLSNGDFHVHIHDSRFEQLGKNGRAHGVYVGGGELHITDSLFLAAVSQGHEIKSRARKTFITNSVIASLAGDDSRLVDVPNGGELLIENSVLEKGPYSTNATAIGYGLEGIIHTQNSITLKKNAVILERDGFNQLLDARAEKPFTVLMAGNVVVSKDPLEIDGFNWLFSSRKEAKMEKYPKLPVLVDPEK